ncbi:TPA: single-stranded DNA-binding protein [Streptococcus agalactiae]|nr:single-stranded DNA-binding protein [Streptococcus agalactiae]HEN9347526.1 single-stranded DNA-binding protein [Streptococcus agalactiae]HEO2002324.1 single-stranded DNA-binding protein [Streptococcus agalactiae]HEO3105192.1 single-stranded DNA-binding protein [Streptococcus agalactiae]HEO3835134.1 single-stranded DNA-binding protein [Streptococcus agalactiae]
MMNNVVLVGRLTRDVELKYTQSNVAVATFTLAVNRPFKNEAGEREADFINCVIWRQSAENLANWCKKGALIGITGRIQTRNYENQQGQRVYVTEVIAESFQLLESRKDNSQGAPQNNQGYQQPNNNYQQPQNNQGYQQQSSQGFNQGQQGSFFDGMTTNPVDISDDDLPF